MISNKCTYDSVNCPLLVVLLDKKNYNLLTRLIFDVQLVFAVLKFAEVTSLIITGGPRLLRVLLVTDISCF